MNLTLLTTPTSSDYELIDSGDAEKLERFGSVLVRRPDPQALWRKKKSADEWNNADASFLFHMGKGKWYFKDGFESNMRDWQVKFDEICFDLKFQSFKHVGIFPEQYPNWQWIKEVITKHKKQNGDTPAVLNLFAYTGGATIAALQAGAKVTHVDTSPGSVDWAKKNAELSGVAGLPVRWMVDDARKFVEREIRRGAKYHAVIMDPPAYGRTDKGKSWTIEEDFLPLMDSIRKVLHGKPLFVILNGYSAGYSPLAYAENLAFLKEEYGGIIEAGELSLEESGGRSLPAGIFTRWSSLGSKLV